MPRKSHRKYRRAQRYYRWLLPEPLPEPVPLMKMGFCIFSGSCTGSDTGTTAKPEVPALPAELPPLRVRFLLPVYRWGAALHRAVVPPFGPVLPVLRESEPNGQISQGTYLKGFLPQRSK